MNEESSDLLNWIKKLQIWHKIIVNYHSFLGLCLNYYKKYELFVKELNFMKLFKVDIKFIYLYSIMVINTGCLFTYWIHFFKIILKFLDKMNRKVENYFTFIMVAAFFKMVNMILENRILLIFTPFIMSFRVIIFFYLS